MGYAKMPQAESWKVDLIREIIGDEYIVHLSNDEKEEILHFACTSWGGVGEDFFASTNSFLSSSRNSVPLNTIAVLDNCLAREWNKEIIITCFVCFWMTGAHIVQGTLTSKAMAYMNRTVIFVNLSYPGCQDAG